MPRIRVRLALVALVIAGSQRDALADEIVKEATKPILEEVLEPRRTEIGALPIVGGNSDVGVQLGGAMTLTRFEDEKRPYKWNIDLVLSASVKNDDNGTRLVQHMDVIRFVDPDLLGDGRVRLDSRANFVRTINAGWYGVGNATTVDLPPGQTSFGRRFQYLQQEGRVRAIARIRTKRFFDVALALRLRYDEPESYAGSKLADDFAARRPDGSPLIHGSGSLFTPNLAAGVMVDTRDSEFVATRGVFYQVGVGYTLGTSESIDYGQASAVLSHYAPLVGPLIFASRFVGSFQFGTVPFYDLLQGGVFESQSMFGGENGVRGVPSGRYAGLVKMLANTEIRWPFPRFHVLGHRARFGSTTFFDAGRVWADYARDPVVDGTRLGLKWGLGGGLFFQWGEAAIVRVEAAYSPDAADLNPRFPVGIYVADRMMF